MFWGLNFPDFGNVPPHSLAAGRSEAHAAHHWMLLLSSVPFASDIFIFPMDWPTWFTPSFRGGMRSLMRSRPLASSKLVILCWGENPRMAGKGIEKTQVYQAKKNSDIISYWVFIPEYQTLLKFPGHSYRKGPKLSGLVGLRGEQRSFFFSQWNERSVLSS